MFDPPTCDVRHREARQPTACEDRSVPRPSLTQNQQELLRHVEEFRSAYRSFGAELESFLQRDMSTVVYAKVWSQGRLAALRLKPAEAIARQFGIDLEIPILVATYTGDEELEPRTLRHLESPELRGGIAAEKDIAILVATDPKAVDMVRDRKRFGYPVIVILTDDLESGRYRDRTVREELGRLLRSVNHFEFNNEIVEPADFFGRTSDISALTQSVEAGNSIGIFGLRRAGKTSLLYRVRDELRQRGFASVYLQLNAIDDGDQLREEMTRAVAETVRDRGLSIPSDLALIDARGRFRPTSESLLRRRWIYDVNDLLDVLDVETVFLVDETDRANEEQRDAIDASDPDHRRDVNLALQQLRGLIQIRTERNKKRASILSAGVAASIYSAAVRFGRENQLFGFITPRPLGPMNREEMAAMVRTLGKRSGMRFDDRHVIDKLYREYGGHPHLTRRACSLVAEAAHRRGDVAVPYQVTPADVETAFEDPSETSPSAAAWENLRSFERWYPIEAAQVYELLRSGKPAASPDMVPHAVDFGLLESDGSLRMTALRRQA